MGSYGYKYKLQLIPQEIKNLETYKIKNQEQQRTRFTTTQVRRMQGTQEC